MVVAWSSPYDWHLRVWLLVGGRNNGSGTVVLLLPVFLALYCLIESGVLAPTRSDRPPMTRNLVASQTTHSLPQHNIPHAADRTFERHVTLLDGYLFPN